MEYFSVIDCGTTNSRIYLLNNKFQIINKGNEKIGVRDTAISGSKEKLKHGLTKLFFKIVEDAGLDVKDIKFVIASGMITSEIGLLEIPHLWAPVGVSDLANNLKVVQDPEIFPLEIPLILIRGVKNYYPQEATFKEIRRVDFMRGEETQSIGLLALRPDIPLPSVFVILSSHTKYIFINKEKKIIGCLTTLSGQLYEAIKKETSIGKSIAGSSQIKNNYFNLDLIKTAYNVVQNVGFLRSLIMPRFMEVLLKTEWYERDLFINSAIIAEDLKVMKDFSLFKFSPNNSNFILVGHKQRCEILKHLLELYYDIENEVEIICKNEYIERLSIEGSISIAREAGYF